MNLRRVNGQTQIFSKSKTLRLFAAVARVFRSANVRLAIHSAKHFTQATSKRMARDHNSRSHASLPGPRGRFRSTWKLITRPYENYSSWSQKFGQTFLVNALNGKVVVTSNLENIRRVLALRHDETSQFAIGTISPLIGESSVLIVNGEEHKRARSMLAPPFHRDALSKNDSCDARCRGMRF